MKQQFLLSLAFIATLSLNAETRDGGSWTEAIPAQAKRAYNTTKETVKSALSVLKTSSNKLQQPKAASTVFSHAYNLTTICFAQLMPGAIVEGLGSRTFAALCLPYATMLNARYAATAMVDPKDQSPTKISDIAFQNSISAIYGD